MLLTSQRASLSITTRSLLWWRRFNYPRAFQRRCSKRGVGRAGGGRDCDGRMKTEEKNES